VRALRLLPVAVVVTALAAGVGHAGRAARSAPDRSAYEGLGTWVDVFDPAVFSRPGPAVARMATLGVTTLYVETSNSRQRHAVVRPRPLGRLLDAAHDADMDVVAWYLPDLTAPARDRRRAVAALRFRSPDGGRFDSFALDIESSAVRNAAVRNRRVLALGRALRRAVGRSYPLGAIIPSPRGMQLLPKYWPRFPYRGLASSFDVFLPMSYFSYRTKGLRAAHDYTARNVAIIRAATGRPEIPIHVIGGVAAATTSAGVRGFVRAARECGTLGASLYDYVTTSPAQWRELSALEDGTLPASLLCASAT
jgi:hypothetical protein